MILCAGLTPAWQHVMEFSSFRYGEVNRAAEVHWFAQGKVLNTGIAAHHLGGPTLTLAPLGGMAFEPIDREFAALGIPRRWLVTRSPTRICTTILDRSSGTMTELVENGKPLDPDELAEFRDVYAVEAAKADVAVIAGSLPNDTPPSYYRELAGRTPCPMILDYRGEGLLECLPLRPLVVKPNREELSQTFGCSLSDDQKLLEAMQSLNHRGAQWVVVTQGDGPVYATSDSQSFRLFPIPAEPLVNPIGCGDCMAAGIAWAVRQGSDILNAVKIGMAAATQNASRLDTGRLDPAKTLTLAKQVRSESVI